MGFYSEQNAGPFSRTFGISGSGLLCGSMREEDASATGGCDRDGLHTFFLFLLRGFMQWSGWQIRRPQAARTPPWNGMTSS